MNIQCPHCGQPLFNDPAMAGQVVGCPFCGNQFRMPQIPVGHLPGETPRTAVTQPASECSIITERQGSYSRTKQQGKARKKSPQGDDTLKMVFGIIGSAVLFLGVFAPFLRVPIFGGVDYFRNGQGDGVIVLVLAGLSFVFVLTRIYSALWFTSIGSLGVIAFTFINFQMKVNEMRQQMEAEMKGNMFAPIGKALADSISIDWGFPVLIIGAGLLIAAAAIPRKLKP